MILAIDMGNTNIVLGGVSISLIKKRVLSWLVPDMQLGNGCKTFKVMVADV